VQKMTKIGFRDGKSVQQWLTFVLLSLQKSYIGNKKDGILTGHPAIDLKASESYTLGIHCCMYGQYRPMSTAGDLKATNTSVNVWPRRRLLQTCYLLDLCRSRTFLVLCFKISRTKINNDQ
jgi:hypothetical protein